MSRSVNDYLLIKHTPGGRTFPALDCWGLVVDYYREILGIDLPPYADLTQEHMAQGFQRELMRGKFQQVDTPKNGDVVAFFCRGILYHVGIYVDGRILHTTERRGCRYERMASGTLTNRRYYTYKTAAM